MITLKVTVRNLVHFILSKAQFFKCNLYILFILCSLVVRRLLNTFKRWYLLKV
jgi:hypothetical protein